MVSVPFSLSEDMLGLGVCGVPFDNITTSDDASCTISHQLKGAGH